MSQVRLAPRHCHSNLAVSHNQHDRQGIDFSVVLPSSSPKDGSHHSNPSASAAACLNDVRSFSLSVAPTKTSTEDDCLSRSSDSLWNTPPRSQLRNDDGGGDDPEARHGAKVGSCSMLEPPMLRHGPHARRGTSLDSHLLARVRNAPSLPDCPDEDELVLMDPQPHRSNIAQRRNSSSSSRLSVRGHDWSTMPMSPPPQVPLQATAAAAGPSPPFQATPCRSPLAAPFENSQSEAAFSETAASFATPTRDQGLPPARSSPLVPEASLLCNKNHQVATPAAVATAPDAVRTPTTTPTAVHQQQEETETITTPKFSSPCVAPAAGNSSLTTVSKLRPLPLPQSAMFSMHCSMMGGSSNNNTKLLSFPPEFPALLDQEEDDDKDNNKITRGETASTSLKDTRIPPRLAKRPCMQRA